MSVAITARGHAAANRSLLTGVGLLLAIVVALIASGAVLPVASVLRGWLVAFAIASSVAVGSIVLLMIHCLTGGAWGRAAAPVLRPAAAMTPLVALAFAPVLTTLSNIYPWAADNSAIPADVARWYLNGPSFWTRAVVALVGWSVLAVVFAAGRGGRLLAGLGLAFFGLTISLVAVDWYLSLSPHYVSSAFAATIAVQQLLAALAVVAVLGGTNLEGKVAGDIGGLLIATLLGVVYLEFMTFVVAWYGDLPEKASWFLDRSSPGWISVLITALAVGAVLPFGMLLKQRVRQSRQGLRVASAAILFGTVLHFIWLLVPSFDDQLPVIAAACAGTAGLVLVAHLTGPALARMLEARHAE